RGTPKTSQWGRSASSSRGLLPLGGTAFRRSKRDPVRPLRRALSDEASSEDPGAVPPMARHPENLAVGEISFIESRPAPAGRYCFPSLQARSGATSATSSIRRGLVRGSRRSTADGAAPRKPRSGGDQLHRVAACSRWAVLLSV